MRRVVVKGCFYQFTVIYSFKLHFLIFGTSRPFPSDLPILMIVHSTQHSFTIEIPEEVYRQDSDAFDSKLSDSVIFSGKFSSLSGDIQKRWERVDRDYAEVTLQDGTQIVVRVSDLPNGSLQVEQTK